MQVKEFEFSQCYTYFCDKFERANYFLQVRASSRCCGCSGFCTCDTNAVLRVIPCQLTILLNARSNVAHLSLSLSHATFSLVQLSCLLTRTCIHSYSTKSLTHTNTYVHTTTNSLTYLSHTYAYIHTCIHTYIPTYIHTRTYTRTYTHIHIHILASLAR
jgi:Peptidase C1-like family